MSELDGLEMPVKIVIGGQPGQHHAVSIGQDDADWLAFQALAELAQDRHGGAGQRGIKIRVQQVGQVDPLLVWRTLTMLPAPARWCC
jgi:hypothetical protein